MVATSIPLRPTTKPETVDQSGKRVIPTVSIETSLIVEAFKDKPIGYECGYKEISDLIGRDILRNRSYLYSAKRILLREHDILLDTLKGSGVRIASEPEKMAASGRDMSTGRRAFKRATNKLEAVSYSALTDEQKKEYNARTSVIGALQLLAASSAVKKIEREIGGEALPSAKTLEIFKR